MPRKKRGGICLLCLNVATPLQTKMFIICNKMCVGVTKHHMQYSMQAGCYPWLGMFWLYKMVWFEFHMPKPKIMFSYEWVKSEDGDLLCTEIQNLGLTLILQGRD